MHGRGGPVLRSSLGPPPPEAGPWLSPRGTRERQACAFVPPHLATHHGSFRKHHTSDSPMAAAFGCDPTGQSGSWSCVPGPGFVLGRNPCAGGLLHPRQLSHSQRAHTWILGLAGGPEPGGEARVTVLARPARGVRPALEAAFPAHSAQPRAALGGPSLSTTVSKAVDATLGGKTQSCFRQRGGRCPLSLSFFPTAPRARAYQTLPVNLLM